MIGSSPFVLVVETFNKKTGVSLFLFLHPWRQPLPFMAVLRNASEAGWSSVISVVLVY